MPGQAGTVEIPLDIYMNASRLPTAMDDRLPRYQQIRDDLARRIAASEWLPEQAIPTEAELTDSYAVSTGTLRKAIDLLVAEGALTRSQGKGTFIRRPRFDSSLFRFFRFKSRSGEAVKPHALVLSRELALPDTEVRSALRLEAGQTAIHLSRLRLVDNAPVLAEDIWLPRDGFQAIETLQLDAFEDLLYPLYEKECRQVVASATETLRVESASAALGSLLQVAVASPLIRVHRVAFDFAGRPIEWRSTWGAADGFEYQIDIR